MPVGTEKATNMPVGNERATNMRKEIMADKEFGELIEKALPKVNEILGEFGIIANIVEIKGTWYLFPQTDEE